MKYSSSRHPQQELSHKITAEWKNVARYLTVEEAQIYSIQKNNDPCTQEQIYQMLLVWKRSKGNDATYRILEKALRQAQRGDLADDVSSRQGKMDITSCSCSHFCLFLNFFQGKFFSIYSFCPENNIGYGVDSNYYKDCLPN